MEHQTAMAELEAEKAMLSAQVKEQQEELSASNAACELCSKSCRLATAVLHEKDAEIAALRVRVEQLEQSCSSAGTGALKSDLERVRSESITPAAGQVLANNKIQAHVKATEDAYRARAARLYEQEFQSGGYEYAQLGDQVHAHAV